MLENLPVRRHVRRLALLALVATALAAVPGRFTPAAAQNQGIVDEDLVDLQAQFAEGSFQRTAVNAGTVSGNAFPDKDGTLQLSPVGSLDPNAWQVSPEGLPVALGDMGVATIGNRLYTVAGSTSATGNAFTDAVYWATLDPQGGALVDRTLPTPPGASPLGTKWFNDPLPQTAAYMNPSPYSPDCDAQPIQSRTNPAVASFVTGTGKDYIYVIGGTFIISGACGSGTLTSPAVQIGTVDAATGDISWSSGDAQRANYLPTQNLPGNESWSTPVENLYVGLQGESLGVEGASASVVTVADGTTYLYVIGGLVSYVDIQGANSMATPAVFYTRLDLETGALEYPLETPPAQPTVWARTANVPLNLALSNPLTAPNPGVLGIYNHTAIVGQAIVGTGTGTTVRNAIYVTGGFTSSEEGDKTANATVFRAKINASDGSLTWDLDLYSGPPADETVTTEGKGRAGAGGIAFSGKLYVFGGIDRNFDRSSFPPLGTATLAAFNDQLDLLPLFGESSNPTYFIGSEGADLFTPVNGLGAAVITAAPPPGATTIDTAAWAYVIGGFNTANQATTTIARGKIGGSGETTGTRRIPDGWYYSEFYNIRLSQGTAEETEARIVAITWFSGIDRSANQNADLRVEFRRTKLLPCNEAAFRDTQWVGLDADTASSFYSRAGDSANEVKLRDVFPVDDFTASCLQFRVYMTQNGNSVDGVPNPAGNGAISPKLYRLAIQKVKPGDPDLYIESFEIGPDDNGQISTFDLKIKNLNGTLINTVAVSPGSFPVVLCVAYTAPGQAAPTLIVPSLPLTSQDVTGDRVNCAPVYRWVPPSETIPGQTFALTNNWQVNFDNVVHIPGYGVDKMLPAPQAAFAVPGNYAVAALIDPTNLKAEGGQGKANNRGENLNNGQPLVRSFTITEAGFEGKVHLPVISR